LTRNNFHGKVARLVVVKANGIKRKLPFLLCHQKGRNFEAKGHFLCSKEVSRDEKLTQEFNIASVGALLAIPHFCTIHAAFCASQGGSWH